VALAADDRTPQEERANAAVAAVSIIHEHELLSSSHNDAVRAVSTVVERAMDPDFVDAVKTLFSTASKARGRRRRRR
jgi:hypothetical protein